MLYKTIKYLASMANPEYERDDMKASLLDMGATKEEIKWALNITPKFDRWEEGIRLRRLGFEDEEVDRRLNAEEFYERRVREDLSDMLSHKNQYSGLRKRLGEA